MSSSAGKPYCICIAGPNGSGKSTLTRRMRKSYGLTKTWIDPDEVAQEVSNALPGAKHAEVSSEAFRLARQRRLAFGVDLKNFGFETVYSHHTNLQFLLLLKHIGYDVHLYFVCTEDPTINILRVQNRVARGGHDVPPAKIVSRYQRSVDLLALSMSTLDQVVLFDNSLERKDGRMLGRVVKDIAQRVELFPAPDIPRWATAAIGSAFEKAGLNDARNHVPNLGPHLSPEVLLRDRATREKYLGLSLTKGLV